MADSLQVVDFGAGRTAKEITGGYEFACAILDTSQVECWRCADYCVICACITSLVTAYLLSSATCSASVAFEVSKTCRIVLCTDSVHAYGYLCELALSKDTP